MQLWRVCSSPGGEKNYFQLPLITSNAQLPLRIVDSLEEIVREICAPEKSPRKADPAAHSHDSANGYGFRHVLVNARHQANYWRRFSCLSCVQLISPRVVDNMCCCPF